MNYLILSLTLIFSYSSLAQSSGSDSSQGESKADIQKYKDERAGHAKN